ncbi:MAG: cobalamin-dependent protein, partial [Thermoplasmata archaeon]
MREFYVEFLEALDREDKERCVQLVVELLEAGDVGIVQLYTEVLAPALNDWECDEDADPTCIWREHVRSQIIRSILEISYPYVLKERRRRGVTDRGMTVAVLCPPEELHEIGPKMVADFFTLAGYDVTFVGANTPIETFIATVGAIKPRYVAVSVTNYYNLVALRKAMERIRDVLPEETEIIVGGGAFDTKPGLAK